MRCLLLAASPLVFVLGACQPPEQPPLAPPAPTDPTVAQALALQPAGVIDAAIVADGGSPLDATVFELDAGAGVR
ncbi:MAG TPA: hypothetical protein VN894_18295 [Polyangiaceae bacterium]|nr:hypothetical protein [Polyangiaceae bacterium]